jgi:NAD-dependent dihydropyrimidine dehydrogenase PreA subunit
LLIIDLERCEGCGACVEVCPEGALYLVENEATVDTSLCDECGHLPPGSETACVVACPREAISLIAEALPSVTKPVLLPTSQPEPTTVQIKTEPDHRPLPARVVPLLGAMVSWAGRELLPLLADSLVRSLDRWAVESQTGTSTGSATRKAPASRREGGKGHRRRRRQRGR